MSLSPEYLVHAFKNPHPDGWIYLDPRDTPDEDIAEALRLAEWSAESRESIAVRFLGPCDVGAQTLRALSEIFGRSRPGDRPPLTELDLRGCTGISDSTLGAVAGLPLERLVLDQRAQVTSLAGLDGLPLVDLEISGCEYLKDISALRGMRLSSLALRGCVSIPDAQFEALRGLPITHLSLWGCVGLRDLGCVAESPVEWLSVEHCSEIVDVAPLADLSGLKALSLARCTGVRSVAPLRGLPLESLSLAGCTEVESIEALAGMPLRTLDLSSCWRVNDLNVLSELPLERLELRKCGAVLGMDEQLLRRADPGGTLAAVRNYQRSRKLPLNECRVFLVGEPYAGKTSLRMALQGEEIPDELPRTREVVVERGVFTTGSGTDAITWHLWDFGGHEFLHATHRCYFTDKCVFALVVDPHREAHGLPTTIRDNEPRPDSGNQITHWRSLIHDHAPSAPVIVVRTRSRSTRKHRLDLSDLASWTESDPSVRIVRNSPIDVDCLPRSSGLPVGIDDLKQALGDLVDSETGDAILRDVVRQEFPGPWKRVRNAAVEKLHRDSAGKVTVAAFNRICEREGIDEAEWPAILDILATLGEVVHFPNDPMLADRVFSVEWVNTALYRIAAQLSVESRSEATWELLIRWVGSPYSTDDLQFLVQLLKSYGIAYELDAKRVRFPAFLPPCPTRAGWGSALWDRRSVDVGPRPERVVQELSVKMHDRLVRSESWRDAAVFRDRDRTREVAVYTEGGSSVVIAWKVESSEAQELARHVYWTMEKYDRRPEQWGESASSRTRARKPTRPRPPSNAVPDEVESERNELIERYERYIASLPASERRGSIERFVADECKRDRTFTRERFNTIYAWWKKRVSRTRD